MVTLTGDSSDRDTRAPHRRDDRSDNSHRQLIGYIGLALPIILVALAAIRPMDRGARWALMYSISAYYYSGAVAAFVGMLVALALFLLTYRGYENKYGWADRAAARIAGCAALLIAFFPAAAPPSVEPLPWWTDATGYVHYASAIVLFLMFAVFSLFLFQLGPSGAHPPPNPPADKRRRNGVYLICGVVILASMAWAGFAGFNKQSIFLPESIALVAFAISWLVKGRADRTLADAVRAVVS